MKTKVRRITTKDGSYRMLFYWCQACDHAHGVRVREGSPTVHPSWEWDGDREKPTLAPSILEFTPAQGDEPQRTLCHHFVRGGRIEYCGDSPHDLSGKTVDLVDIPENYGIGGEEA